MSRLAAWRSMMQQTATIAPRTGQDGFGVATYGTAVSYRCRLVGKRRQVLNAAGQLVISNQTLYLLSADNVLPSARVTLSTGDVGSTESWSLTPPILATGRYPDEHAGFHHTVIYLALFLFVMVA